ncbi:hypothetical protein V8G54_023981 [Vigna mungo]|uniref:Transposase-associated domain-containing protein n=1 Tax=Vigna mungo TaxID=3915 RepID=A0AAQ3N6A4_VIGMU
MGKSWIDIPRNTCQYMGGLNTFLNFAFSNSGVRGKIICPCHKCNFKKWQCRKVVYKLLIVKLFSEEYTVWLLHGERRVNDEICVMAEEDGGRVLITNNMCEMVNDVFVHHCS